MAVKTTVSFDVATFKRAYEEWDIEALLALYADEVELIQDRPRQPAELTTHPPGQRRPRGMLEHCAGAGVVATVDNTIADGRRAAATITCAFPGGRRVLANAILELEDGHIVRELDVLSGDPKGA
jgi:SnoaL-like domain